MIILIFAYQYYGLFLDASILMAKALYSKNTPLNCMSAQNLIPTITADYAKFPEAQTYSIYSSDVYFKDPMYNFRGLDQYQKMIGFITTWFKNLKLDLHEINEAGDGLKTRWTMSWDAPLPWKPRISISGWSELTISPDNLITSHIDYWDCSRLDMIKQHFKF
jgi:hypothetical protein